MHAASALSPTDIRTVAADIKNTLFAAISDLRSDIQAIVLRVEEVEETQARHDDALCQVQQVTESHAVHLREINHHMEDLDNSGRHRNLRVRGLPDSIDSTQLSRSVTALFNELLERPPDSPIAMESIHRALHPRGRDTDPPRDIICFLNDFIPKEGILRKARGRIHFSFQGTDIKIFRDLSNIALQRSRELRPLLDLLRAKTIV